MAKRTKKAKSSEDCGCSGSSEGELAEPMVAIVPAREMRIRVEKASAKEGGFAFEQVGESLVQEDFFFACEKGKPCLPWVKVTRDPKKFESCFRAAQKKGRIENSQDLFELVRDAMLQEDQEVFYVVMVDTQMFVRGIGEIARGARDRVAIPIPDVLRLPLVEGATAFFVAHNHPSGHPNPSQADKELTKAIKAAAASAGLEMLDHIVVGVDSYYSFAGGGIQKVKPRKRGKNV